MVEDDPVIPIPPSINQDIDILDSMDMEGQAGLIVIYRAEDGLFNLWLSGSSGVQIFNIDKEELPSLFSSQIDMFGMKEPLRTSGGNLLRYQTFSGWEISSLSLAEGGYSLLREMDDHVIRKVVDDRIFMMEFLFKARIKPIGNYMLSRLSTQGSPHVPKLLGMAYWDMERGNAPWMRLTELPSGSKPSFRSFLTMLKEHIDEFVVLSGTRAKKFIVQLSVGDHPSFDESRRIGEALGKLHGALPIPGEQRTTGRSSDISDLFHISPFSMQDIGTSIGIGSFYIGELKRDFIRLLGERPKINPVTGRKMKTLKTSLGRLRIEGVDWAALDIFRNHFTKMERRMRASMGLLRAFRGSPTIPSALDSYLQRIQVDPQGNHIFTGFDHELFGVEKGKLESFLPLKDLAMIMNSLMKARYLTARKMFRSMGPRVDPKPLSYFYIDYNLSKRNYRDMMKDFNVLRIFEGREMPFSFVHKISLVSALWYERCRNSLIEGYVKALSDLGKEELLSYPKGVDTVKGIAVIQSILGLSGALRAINLGKVSTSAGLESDLLCSLSV